MPALIPELHTEFVSSYAAIATDEAVAVTGEFASFLADRDDGVLDPTRLRSLFDEFEAQRRATAGLPEPPDGS